MKQSSPGPPKPPHSRTTTLGTPGPVQGLRGPEGPTDDAGARRDRMPPWAAGGLWGTRSAGSVGRGLMLEFYVAVLLREHLGSNDDALESRLIWLVPRLHQLTKEARLDLVQTLLVTEIDQAVDVAWALHRILIEDRNALPSKPSEDHAEF